MERDGVRLAGLDFGGNGPSILLLHGLAGHAGEWADTARGLTDRFRVVALDARGHGRSERFPADVSRAAHVDDAVFAIQGLGLGRVVVVGQSLGGLAALLLAAEHPNLVRGLVVADASAAGTADASGTEAAVAEVSDSLRRWPMPFRSRSEALEFFGGPSLEAEAWVEGLERRDGGWWPRFDVEVMAQTLREARNLSYWDAWELITCPALVVRAGNGIVPAGDAQEMVERGRDATLVELVESGHDLHLDRPDDWRAALDAFLDRLADDERGTR